MHKFASGALLVLALSGCDVMLVPDNGPGHQAGGGTVTLCHKGKKTMELPQEAAGAHINHGDTRGPC